jgi:hypothetical protein
VDNELEGTWQEAVVTYLEWHHSIRLHGLKNNRKDLKTASQSLDRDGDVGTSGAVLSNNARQEQRR